MAVSFCVSPHQYGVLAVRRLQPPFRDRKTEVLDGEVLRGIEMNWPELFLVEGERNCCEGQREGMTCNGLQRRGTGRGILRRPMSIRWKRPYSPLEGLSGIVVLIVGCAVGKGIAVSRF